MQATFAARFERVSMVDERYNRGQWRLRQGE